MGRNAVIIEPQNLRNKMIKDYRQAFNAYQYGVDYEQVSSEIKK